MADVAIPRFPVRHGENMGSMSMADSLPTEDRPGTESDFSMHPWTWQQTTAAPSRRPASASMHIDIPTSSSSSHHRRTASTLPNFAFNASDISGRKDSGATPPQTPEESVTATPTRGGHRRGGSEFVGGDSRFGMSTVLSSSPTKATAGLGAMGPPTGPPPGRRGHAHRRSAAISSHDVSKLMQPSNDVQPRLSSSLPNTPLEYPSQAPHVEDSTTCNGSISDPFGPPLQSLPARPPSRPRVGFSDNVEFIPRPLSTISSETESSLSTIRGHSVNNSLSSMLSLSTPSPPSSRVPMLPLRTHSDESEKRPAGKLLFDKNRRGDNEGQWLKRPSVEGLDRPRSESGIHQSKTTFADPQSTERPRKRASSHALGFDRRRSEPTFGLSASGVSRLSTLSLQDAASPELTETQCAQDVEKKSSARKIRDWAASKISKRTKETNRALWGAHSATSARPLSAESTSVPCEVAAASAPIAETDLDAVFSTHEAVSHSERPALVNSFRVENEPLSLSQPSGAKSSEYDEADTILDLDAALGPFKTPPIGSHRQRKELHSSRLTKDFGGVGGHYHRRAESAPNLPPFENTWEERTSQAGMADVFEEDEEEEAESATRPAKAASMRSYHSAPDTSAQVVDMDVAAIGLCDTAKSDDEDATRRSLEPDRSAASLNVASPSSNPIVFEGRGTSVIEETIPEESSPACEIEIVDADEEPRASSLTKSSDSSETPTVFAPPIGTGISLDSQRPLTTPDTYQTSRFSSPGLGHGSFDHSRFDTAASSMADNRTLSSCTTGEYGQDMRISTDVPSLTSSRSTMISTVHGNGSRRDFSDPDRGSFVAPRPIELTTIGEVRRKRGSIQSLSQLVGGSFGSKTRGYTDTRPKSSTHAAMTAPPVKKEHRLKKLMFWKSKQRSSQTLQSKT